MIQLMDTASSTDLDEDINMTRGFVPSRKFDF